MTIESEGEKIEIGAARSRFSLRTFPVDDFPSLPDPPQPATFLPASSLAGALRQVVRAASSDDARPLLTGVLIAAEGGGIRLVATDSYRLAMRDIDGSDALTDSSQILVPARALAELQKLSVLGRPRRTRPRPRRRRRRRDGLAPTIGLSIGDHDVTFTAGDVKVSTRLLDGNYPDYRQLIPPEYPNRLHVGKDSLLDALRRVRLLVRDNTTPVRLSMRSGGVDLTVVSQEVGDASETVDADFEGKELDHRLQPHVPDRRGRGRVRGRGASSRPSTPPNRRRCGPPKRRISAICSCPSGSRSPPDPPLRAPRLPGDHKLPEHRRVRASSPTRWARR